MSARWHIAELAKSLLLGVFVWAAILAGGDPRLTPARFMAYQLLLMWALEVVVIRLYRRLELWKRRRS